MYIHPSVCVSSLLMTRWLDSVSCCPRNKIIIDRVNKPLSSFEFDGKGDDDGGDE